jgi:beta-lactam-binding protein with PASTA domain
VRERGTEVTRVVEEGTTPPAGPPIGPWPDRDLWPWLLLLLVLVVGGIIAAVLLTRDDHKKKAAPRTTVVATAPAPTTTVTVGTTTTPTATTTKPTPRPAVTRVKLANVLGIPASTAVKRLRDDGLQPLVRSVYSTKPSGIVAAQKPGPGTQVAKGSTVTLDVSKGQPAKPVPDVVGQSATQAVSLLKAAGFGATPVQVPSPETKGNVIAQKPKAGEKAQPGTKVRLNVSSGAVPSTQPTSTSPPKQTTTTPSGATTTRAAPAKPATVTVPDVQGKTLDQARLAIRNAGLVTEIKYVPSNEAAGTVVAQARKPGTTAKRGDHMLINVSLGSGPASSLVTVPNVVGQDEQTAQSQLQQAGFVAVVQDSPTSDSSQDGQVVDEQPAPGTKAPKGSQIIIYVGRATSTG